MPHKRNPILAERICGLARVLRGYAQVGLENIALWHERDISHSGAERVILPDATIALDYMQHLATRIVEGMTVHTERMRENLELTHGALFSQRALTALVESGMTRDDAYRLVQENGPAGLGRGTPSFRELIARGGAAARPRRGLRLRRLSRARPGSDRLGWIGLPRDPLHLRPEEGTARSATRAAAPPRRSTTPATSTRFATCPATG